MGRVVERGNKLNRRTRKMDRGVKLGAVGDCKFTTAEKARPGQFDGCVKVGVLEKGKISRNGG